jgi:hypothetical protein
LEKAFPQRDDQLVVVIDGATPELAEAAAQSLKTDRLRAIIGRSLCNMIQRQSRLNPMLNGPVKAS